MRLGLGPTTVPLQDGLGSWDASAADTLAIWNGYLDFINISSVSSSTVPETSGDGVNSVFFSSTIFGDSFGAGTLAVTVLLNSASQSPVISEADVVVNSAYRYNSYRGPQQSGVYDFHRIVLHEFGHVLGLGHDTSYPLGTKIMEPIISDWDHLGPDDIAGVRSLYGADFYYPTVTQTLRVGYYFIYDLHANNNPTSYSATVLPPGLTLESTTGRIIGTPTRSGVYSAVITAHGAIANAYTPFQMTVLGLEEVPGLLSILPLGASSLVADPIRPRIYVAGYAGISIIDTTTFEVTNLRPDFVPNARLSISADASTLLYTSLFAYPVQEFRIDLNSLSVLPTLLIPGNDSAVLEGLNNQAYVTGANMVYQFDATTGALQQSFAPPRSTSTAHPTIAISPDRQTLYVSRESVDGDLSAYDISTADPVLLNQLSGSFSSLTPSRDGRLLYYVNNQTAGHSLVQANLPALSPTKSVFTSSHYLGPTEVGLDGSIYQSIFPDDNELFTPSGSFSVYNPVTLQRTADVPIGNLQAELYPYLPLDIVFDNSGKYFFSIVQGFYGEEVWVFSTNLASFPPPVHATKNLLNISTRGRVETGEDVMIGGFIVLGPNPKKVAIRGLGPSLPITGAMANPVLELYDSSGKLLTSNDNWTSNRLNIIGTLLAPSSERESALLVMLPPGAYTTIVRDLNNQPGLALVEVYDLDPKDSRLANISTRGKVATGDSVLIGGFIIGGADPTKVLVRAIGPSLATKGIGYPLADPILELHDGNGKLIFTNDDWRSTQASGIFATGIPPTDDRESAILTTLQPGNYTAIVRGKNGATGVALVEVYNLDSN